MNRLDRTEALNRLKIYVETYEKNDVSISIGLKLVLDEFETVLFTFIQVPVTEMNNSDLIERKKPKYYVNQALKKLKKDIKDWVIEVQKQPTIVGEEVTIPDDFF